MMRHTRIYERKCMAGKKKNIQFTWGDDSLIDDIYVLFMHILKDMQFKKQRIKNRIL